MKIDTSILPYGDNEILSVKAITGRLSRSETRTTLEELLEKVRGEHEIVRITLYEDELQQEHGNNFVTAQWTHVDVKDIPNIHEDELIGNNILLRWNESHDETKKILEW